MQPPRLKVLAFCCFGNMDALASERKFVFVVVVCLIWRSWRGRENLFASTRWATTHRAVNLWWLPSNQFLLEATAETQQRNKMLCNKSPNRRNWSEIYEKSFLIRYFIIVGVWSIKKNSTHDFCQAGDQLTASSCSPWVCADKMTAAILSIWPWPKTEKCKNQFGGVFYSVKDQ